MILWLAFLLFFSDIPFRYYLPINYGLDGPGSNPDGDEIFHPSRPALGPTQPPVKWVLDITQG